ncbi:hypothetical protein M419DRAFT_116960 [Trichoderma reesei RUT C-30]|uniref:Uncharacterized protein n=1 Tax=Hypocrea jecorina (strain ATCC 56765 / BCRC 32924 / NRRL 11460 / Rut C-30) TaxID=1344414 RepID=A0A024SMP1_HYPJR|nr:hypothetical protein M419DRAFT_116960 [Trichoderma reesei RUT C-30]
MIEGHCEHSYIIRPPLFADCDSFLAKILRKKHSSWVHIGDIPRKTQTPVQTGGSNSIDWIAASARVIDT